MRLWKRSAKAFASTRHPFHEKSPGYISFRTFSITLSGLGVASADYSGLTITQRLALPAGIREALESRFCPLGDCS